MMEPTWVVPVVTTVAVGILLLRLLEPARRTPVAATVEALSVTLSGVLTVQLLVLGGSWSELLAIAGLTAVFGTSLASVLSMGRAIAAALVTRAWRDVPFDAIVSFAAVSAAATFLSGAMLVAAFGWRLTALVATVAILRAGAYPWRAHEVTERWSWGPLRPVPTSR
ncbi:MAG: hypothetical protein R6V28_05055 [Nitriliruptoraceae bacterium]